MKIITKPTVTLIGYPIFNSHPKYLLPEHPYDAENIIAHAGKGCYDSYGIDGRSVTKHIESLIDSGHGSVLEHANFTLFLEGISRGCSHEIVRHRAGFAYSQRSTRYTAEEDAAMVLEPYYADIYNRGLKERTEREDRILSSALNSFEYSLSNYVDAVHALITVSEDELEQKGITLEVARDKRKWARGKARQLLPHALETRITMTGNVRAWRHFIEQRSNPGAEPEIRRLTECIFKVLQPLAPSCFNYKQEVISGFPYYITMNVKV